MNTSAHLPFLTLELLSLDAPMAPSVDASWSVVPT